MALDRIVGLFRRHPVTASATAVAVVLYVALAVLHQGWLVPMAGGLQSPDMHVTGYSAETVKAWIDGLGREGRIAFLNLHTFFLDLLFPPAFAFASASLSLTLGSRVGWFSRMAGLRRVVLAAAAPVFYLGFDWSENLAVARLVADPATISADTVAAASLMTLWKWILVALAIALPAVLYVMQRRNRGTK